MWTEIQHDRKPIKPSVRLDWIELFVYELNLEIAYKIPKDKIFTSNIIELRTKRITYTPVAELVLHQLTVYI